MIYNDCELTEYLTVTNISREMLPNINLTTLQLPNRDGSELIKKQFGDRVLNVEVVFIGANAQDLMEKIEYVSYILNQEDYKVLQFLDEEHYYKAILQGSTPIDQVVTTGRATFSFLCKPYKFGDTRTNTTGVINYNGYIDTKYWEIAITATAIGSALTISNGVDSIVLTKAIAISNVIKVDFEKRTITLNDVSVMENISLSSKFFKLATGTITVTGTANTFAITYTEIY